MGRKPSTATTDGTVHLGLDPALKKRAAIAAIRAGVTLSELVSRALVAYLRSASTTPAKRQGTLPLDERQPEARS